MRASKDREKAAIASGTHLRLQLTPAQERHPPFPPPSLSSQGLIDVIPGCRIRCGMRFIAARFSIPIAGVVFPWDEVSRLTRGPSRLLLLLWAAFINVSRSFRAARCCTPYVTSWIGFLISGQRKTAEAEAGLRIFVAAQAVSLAELLPLA